MRHLVRRDRGLTVVEVVAVVVLVAVLAAVLITVLAANQRTTHPPHARNQLRGIHQGLVIFGQSNMFYYPGLDSKGQPLPDGPDTTGNSGAGTTVEARYWILLQGDFFTPEYAISPSEIQAITEYDPDVNRLKSEQFSSDLPGPVTSQNYSYAMLDIDAQGSRVEEWKVTVNARAIVMSDRNTGTAASPTSIHSQGKDGWRGSVLWNDNHVGFEQQPYFETQYGSGELIDRDHLFTDNNGNDASLIYSGK